MESRSPPDAEIALLQQDEEMDLDEVIAEEGSLIRIGEDELTIPTANPSKKEIQEIKIAHWNIAATSNSGPLSGTSCGEVVCAVPPSEDGKDVGESFLEKQGSAISPTDDVNIREIERNLAADGRINFANSISAKDMEVCPRKCSCSDVLTIWFFSRFFLQFA